MKQLIPDAALDKHVALLGMTGAGKALALDTILPTPTGWTTMGDVRVNDLLLDEHGVPCRVTFVTEIQRDRECFELTFSDGTTVVADADHLWLTITDASRVADDNAAAKLRRGYVRTGGRENRWQCRRRSWPALLDTKTIKETLITSRNRFNHAVRNGASLKLPKVVLPIDPYVLGCWLGDGTSCTGTLTTADQEVIDNIRMRGFQIRSPYNETRPTTCRTYRIAFGPSGIRFTTMLRRAGLLSNKHVPSTYLRASEEQRLELLMGLMDTDGTVQRGSNGCVFYNTNERLARDAYELVCSLGWGATLRTKRARLNGVDHGACYEIRFRPTQQVFALKRKGDLLNFEVGQGIRYLRRMIKRVMSTASVPVRCIQVDSPSHLYLCSRAFIPTHNTSVIKTAIVEPDLEADRRVLIITPKDDWWGLRLSKTGKSRGFDIPIFGGRRADYPLQVRDAALLADAYGTMRGSAILCTALLSVQDRARWFSAFAERLLSANRGWLRVVIDEAHVFMPKQGGKGGGAIPAGLHAGNELVSQGRSQGLRIVLASQRSAKLHNDALTQCSCLFAMLLMAPADRDAVKDWIIDQADPERGKEIIASLANLKPGQSWVWAPGAKFLECVQFPLPSTFDSSAAPDDDTGTEHKLAPINLDALKGKLATVEAERKANDPKELRTRIVELQSQLDHMAPAVDTDALKVQFYAEGYADATSAIRTEMTIAAKAVSDACHRLEESGSAFTNIKDWAERAAPVAPTKFKAIERTRPVPPPRPAQPQENGQYSPSQLKVLKSLAAWRSLGHAMPTREMVAAVAGYKPSTGNYGNIIGQLVIMGAVGKPSAGRLSLHESGIGAMDREEARETLLQTLSPSQKKLIEALLSRKVAISREELAELSGYQPSTGNFGNLIGQLNVLNVTEKPATGFIALSDWARELLQ